MLFKKKITRALPEGAKICRRGDDWYAEWRTGDGKLRKERALVDDDGTARLLCESRTWYCRYRDAKGWLHEVNTKCADRDMAARVAAKYERMRELVESGIMTGTEADAADWAHVSLVEHIKAFRAHNEARGLHSNTVKVWGYYLRTIADECRFHRFADVSRVAVERWLLEQVKGGMGARTFNAHVAAAVSFGNWAVKQGRITVNPFAGIPKRNERADRRRVRRALTYKEAAALLDATRRRPVHDALKGNAGRGEKMDKARAAVSNATLDRLRWTGETRAMAYAVMLGTGLRYGELRSIRIGAVHLDHTPPYLELAAKDEKARRGAQIPLQRDLASELGKYLAERRSRLLGDCSAFPGAFNDKALFDGLPEKMTKVFDRDLVFAGLATVKTTKDRKKRIVKCDDSGRTLDVHCLRHTFITNLAKSGVPLQVAQKAARHSSPVLTSNIYTHLRLDDIAEAVEKLPDFTGGIAQAKAAEMGQKNVALNVAPPAGTDSHNLSVCGGLCGTQVGSTLSPKTREKPNKSGVFNGGRSQTRTADPLHVKQVL